MRKPVKRTGADLNLLLTLLSFAGSVGITRLFLELTGYPQLGGGEYHIAHVLWGGLLLFVASLLPQIFSNRWVYRVGAITAGVGVGLFIDEVGKFITASNDYFHPTAAPIIYAFFMMTVLVYMQVRNPPRRSARAELYRALDGLEELLDQDLDREERQALIDRLEFIAEHKKERDLASLAGILKNYLEDDSIHIAPMHDTVWEHWLERFRRWEDRYFPYRRIKPILLGALLGLAVTVLYGVFSLIKPELAAARLQAIVLAGLLDTTVQQGWFIARLVLQTAVGLLLVVALVLLVSGRDEAGINLGMLAMLISLTTVNLVVFYFNQFSTILKAAVELAVLLALARFRYRLRVSSG